MALLKGEKGHSAAARLRIEIFPDNLDQTVAFYTQVLGFTLARDERAAPHPYVAVELGTVLIGAAARPGEVHSTQRQPPVGVEIVLEVPDLQDALRRARETGWPLEESLVDRPWGLSDFRLVDPAGYYIRVTN